MPSKHFDYDEFVRLIEAGETVSFGDAWHASKYKTMYISNCWDDCCYTEHDTLEDLMQYVGDMHGGKMSTTL